MSVLDFQSLYANCAASTFRSWYTESCAKKVIVCHSKTCSCHLLCLGQTVTVTGSKGRVTGLQPITIFVNCQTKLEF